MSELFSSDLKDYLEKRRLLRRITNPNRISKQAALKILREWDNIPGENASQKITNLVIAGIDLRQRVGKLERILEGEVINSIQGKGLILEQIRKLLKLEEKSPKEIASEIRSVIHGLAKVWKEFTCQPAKHKVFGICKPFIQLLLRLFNLYDARGKCPWAVMMCWVYHHPSLSPHDWICLFRLSSWSWIYSLPKESCGCLDPCPPLEFVVVCFRTLLWNIHSGRLHPRDLIEYAPDCSNCRIFSTIPDCESCHKRSFKMQIYNPYQLSSGKVSEG